MQDSETRRGYREPGRQPADHKGCRGKRRGKAAADSGTGEASGGIYRRDQGRRSQGGAREHGGGHVLLHGGRVLQRHAGSCGRAGVMHRNDPRLYREPPVQRRIHQHGARGPASSGRGRENRGTSRQHLTGG